jgi:hypothetical protein
VEPELVGPTRVLIHNPDKKKLNLAQFGLNSTTLHRHKLTDWSKFMFLFEILIVNKKNITIINLYPYRKRFKVHFPSVLILSPTEQTIHPIAELTI